MDIDENGTPIVGSSSDEDGNVFADATGSPQDDAMSTAVARPTIRLKVDCPDSTCTGGQDGGRWSFEGDVEVSIVQLQFHVKHGHERAAPAADIQAKKPCPPPLQLPKLPGQCSEAKFEEFKKLWEFYKNSLDMPGGTITSYLLSCLDDEVRKDVHAANANITTMSKEQVLAAAKQYTIQQRAISSLKMDLGRLTQDEGEPVRKFYAMVKELTSRRCPAQKAHAISTTRHTSHTAPR